MQFAIPQRLEAFWTRRIAWQRWVMGIAGTLLAWPVVMTLVYGVLSPPISNLMIARLFTGNGLHKQWVDLDQMSPNLVRAVLSSEDARFCLHHGVDWVEFQDAMSGGEDGEGPTRGASTISMQTAKNLFLWDGHAAIVRKVLEMPMAYWMDFVWTKRRMIEVYLNIVEWAPGVYGAEAAAQLHFRKSAARLTKREAALLAAVLPNPIKRSAGKPSRRVQAIAARIQMRMSGMDFYLACISK